MPPNADWSCDGVVNTGAQLDWGPRLTPVVEKILLTTALSATSLVTMTVARADIAVTAPTSTLPWSTWPVPLRVT
jgi:hypothetical protein